ncbi:type IV pilus secretin PilQ [Aidingimonas lacisalsi]|uniref:type IV pilus secretin PilQ n=1 Tax=Aidingimonas lacisalsi TaxID=2604086 RepID=UPI0011D1A180
MTGRIGEAGLLAAGLLSVSMSVWAITPTQPPESRPEVTGDGTTSSGTWENEPMDEGRAPDPMYSGRRLSLDFRGIDVREVLAVIAEFTDINVVVSDSVVGEVTLRLQDVPWDQALDLILQSQGLASHREGNVILVAPAEELAARERETVDNLGSREALLPLETEYLPVRYAKAEALAALLRGNDGLGVLSARGRIGADARTNTLLIQDVRDRIDRILSLVEQLDVAVRQVQIEARIVIARDSVTKELGVNWSAASTRGFRQGAGDVGYSAKDLNPDDLNRAEGGLEVDLGDQADASTGLNFGYLAGDVLLDLELRALESEGKSQTLSQPRIITANQRAAVIKQGTEIPYQESTSSGATSTEFKEAVLSLEVTPQITPDDSIVMDLAINNDTVSERSVGGALAIDTSQIETQVLVGDGETVVLGGILTRDQMHSLLKTPLLGDLPILGQLFRYTQDSSEKVELLVFITPRIIDDNVAVH